MAASRDCKTQSALAKKSGVAQSTIGRILRGDVSPQTDTWEALARALGTSVSVLLQESEGEPGNHTGWTGASPLSNVQLVPLISEVSAGSFDEAIDNYQPGDGKRWLAGPERCGRRTVALYVDGESMEPRYQNRDIIFVDPQADAIHGKDVVVRLDDRNAVTFKRLIIEGERRYLRPLNPNWPQQIIEFPEGARIVGVVVGRYTDI